MVWVIGFLIGAWILTLGWGALWCLIAHILHKELETAMRNTDWWHQRWVEEKEKHQ